MRSTYPLKYQFDALAIGDSVDVNEASPSAPLRAVRLYQCECIHGRRTATHDSVPQFRVDHLTGTLYRITRMSDGPVPRSL